MLKKIWAMFVRDIKVGSRDFISAYIMIIPILLAVLINIFTPSVNDTTVNLALIEGENPTQEEYFRQFAKVELLPDYEAIESRVASRDDIFGVIPSVGGYYVLAQGNEMSELSDYAALLITLFDMDVSIEDSNAELEYFGETIPPIKKMLVNFVIMMISVLGGMLIAMNIVEEKMDKTIKAINVTTVSRTMYIAGKSMIGVIFPIIGTLLLLLITGFGSVNYGQVLLMLMSVTMLAIVIGFIEGLNNDDIINAAGSIKLIFLPVMGAIAGAELLADKWQFLLYWIPFYWTYKGNNAILSSTSTWSQILLYTLIVFALCSVVYIILIPKIRKGLE